MKILTCIIKVPQLECTKIYPLRNNNINVSRLIISTSEELNLLTSNYNGIHVFLSHETVRLVPANDIEYMSTHCRSSINTFVHS